eukprot:scaffold457_cov172-Cylindrotheca_fusiformis.AAC.1
MPWAMPARMVMKQQQPAIGVSMSLLVSHYKKFEDVCWWTALAQFVFLRNVSIDAIGIHSNRTDLGSSDWDEVSKPVQPLR